MCGASAVTELYNRDDHVTDICSFFHRVELKSRRNICRCWAKYLFFFFFCLVQFLPSCDLIEKYSRKVPHREVYIFKMYVRVLILDLV